MATGRLVLTATLYARGHSWAWGIVAAAALSGAALSLAETRVPTPELLGRVGVGLNADIFIASLFGAVVARCLGGPIRTLEHASFRPLWSWNIATVVLLLVPVLFVSTIALQFDAYDFPLRFVRNCSFMIGISTIVVATIGEREAATMPVIVLLANAIAGSNSAGRPFPWAFLRAAPSSGLAAFGLGFACAAAVISPALARRTRKSRTWHNA